ncbi:hypothetical protein HW115_04570 [Verrucomicrobiaceae bacterium N1E253]|uniref:Uncharacterized protein n=1 Tax=Oceaniferula marina TaxID=2748318 RepID=A0A851GJL1_9BACT|nr:hypothetical protein [Oceaniferula marina]NWK54870.1 hypothetical protein [Oceaniferula marina]
MQQTKFDQWLKETFLYETHILTMRLPDDPLPRGVVIKELDQKSKADYRYCLEIASGKKVEQVIAHLKENNMMYATHVVEVPKSYKRLIAPEGKSFSLMWIMRGIGLVLLLGFLYGTFKLMQNQGLMRVLDETMKDFQ